MTKYPHTRIFVGSSTTLDIAGPHIQVLDTSSGEVLHSSHGFSESDVALVLKSGPIRCAAVSQDFSYLLTSGEDKLLKLWAVDGLKLLSERELPKKATNVAFTADAQTLLVSDKFGDIFSYPFNHTPPVKGTQEKSKDALSSHENPSGGQLILGHASPLNAFLLSADEKFIITADRDEHIRVSWFPKGYNIEMYCLGHLKFVSALHIPSFDHSSLISGGGDPVLKIWNWMNGVVKHEVPVLEVVEPFIAVRATKRKRDQAEDDGDETPKALKGKGKRKQGRKEKQREVHATEGDHAAILDTDGKDENLGDSNEEKPEKVLVIRKVASVNSDSGAHIVFSAVGTTALFAFPFKNDVSASEIQCIDFARPVLDFTIVDVQSILVSLDGEWLPEGVEDSPRCESMDSLNGPMAKLLKIAGGKFVEDSETLKPLVNSLNSGSLLPATSEDLKRLDLYSDLVTLPKYVDDDTETNDVTRQDMPIGAPDLSSSEMAKSRGKGKTELSKKELGRLKLKQAVMAKANEKVRKADDSDVDEELKTKKSRSEASGPEADHMNEDEADVNMVGS
ncbi:hypothetical protein M413DRAFT_442627 [Hebeloma cylindrosporum]|uniref:Uncharacterized protein n=1 Tax=Hebeloma cylindrosporum TaxID=76867 RepID=A0A0C2Y4B4_HEBCY|nr:hypothetical protein M413DRAFT_442627 [Hebeloma cylindrosporum h7]